MLGLLAEGRSQSDIAGELVISQNTVGTHIEHILSKLGVESRAQAVALAYKDRLLDTYWNIPVRQRDTSVVLVDTTGEPRM